MGFFFCICPDGKLIQEQLTTLTQDTQAKRAVYWGDDGLGFDFWENLSLASLSAESTILIVRQAQNLDALTWKKISQTLSKPVPNLLILCLEGAWEKGQPKLPAHVNKLGCLGYADQKKWVWRSPGLGGSTLKSYLGSKVKALGLSFEPGVLAVLPDLLPLDAASLESELNKLSLFSGGAALSLAQVQDVLLAQSTEFNMFALIRTIESGRNPWPIILEEQKKGEDQLFYLLVMLEREARQLWQILMGEKVWLSAQDQQLKTDLARKLGRKGLSKFFSLLIDAELAVKSGQYSSTQALDKLIASLTLLTH